MTLQKKALLGCMLAIGIFLLIGFLFYQSMQEFMFTADERKKAFGEVILLEQALSGLKDVETAQRGFILTGEKKYLEPYQQSLPELHDHLAQLSIGLRDSVDDQRTFLQLKGQMLQKLAEMEKMIQLQRDGHKEQAFAMVKTGQGKRLMDSIRFKVRNMGIEKMKRVQETDAALKKNANKTAQVAIYGGGIGFFLFITVFMLLNREMGERYRANILLQEEARERERAQLQVDELNTSLEEQVASLNALNKELEAFSYSVSHDLRAPLRSIDGFSLALLDGYSDKLDAAGRDYLNRVRTNTQRMAQLIDDMLQLSRLSRGEMSIDWVNLSEVAREIAQDLQAENINRIAEIKIQPDIQVQGDFRLLQAVLQNLLSNAWKFTSHHPQATIEFGQSVKDGKEVYFVKDDGAGFEMEYVDKLFGAFQRLHAMHEFPGTGIGLATVQRIIHRHGGRVWAEGAIEQGATFYFSINS